jgi:release factor glutamine methyltransferase
MRRQNNWPRWKWERVRELFIDKSSRSRRISKVSPLIFIAVSDTLTTPATLPSVASTLAALQARGLERLDAQLLLLQALKQPDHQRAWLLAHDTDPVDAMTLERLDALTQRRLRGEPLAYLSGSKEFFGLSLHIDDRVLVPRPDTETLVDWALEVLDAASGQEALAPARPLRALDLGTGSGAIALALKSNRPALHVDATDYSVDALTVAQANAQRLGLPIEFHQGSWLGALPQGTPRFDLIVSNPPYIAAHNEHLPALAHEPLQALVSGADGLDDLRLIIAQASACVQPGGWLLLEHGYDQSATVRELLEAACFEDVQSRKDLNGIERCSGGRTPATRS